MTRSTAYRVLAILFIGAAISPGVLAAPTSTLPSSENSIGAQAMQTPAPQGHDPSPSPASVEDARATLDDLQIGHDNAGPSWLTKIKNVGTAQEKSYNDFVAKTKAQKKKFNEVKTETLTLEEKKGKYGQMQKDAKQLENDFNIFLLQNPSLDRRPGYTDTLSFWIEVNNALLGVNLELKQRKSRGEEVPLRPSSSLCHSHGQRLLKSKKDENRCWFFTLPLCHRKPTQLSSPRIYLTRKRYFFTVIHASGLGGTGIPKEDDGCSCTPEFDKRGKGKGKSEERTQKRFFLCFFKTGVQEMKRTADLNRERQKLWSVERYRFLSASHCFGY
ncbi:hypothetical protein FB446DRAFT_708962 [Lentinula raphanica]|nr:hypothetical protein FB446DRAFT_708962 [Lentinula raphanica]